MFYTNGYDVKGLEFDVVFIINFNTANYPLSKELKKIKDENDGKEMTLIKDDVLEFINREKRLLYVAMTRAKEKLYLVADCKNSNISSFIYDFNTKYYEAQNFKKKEIEENYNRYKINMEREYGIIIEDDDSNNVKNNDTKQENKFNTESKEKGKDDIDKIKVFFINKGIEVVDNRDKSGCLWIVAGKEAIPLMKKFGVLGYNFIFIANGGRASKNRPAWYLKNS